MVRIEPSWGRVLAAEFEQPYFQQLVAFVRQEYAAGPCYPPGSKIFNAFNTTANTGLTITRLWMLSDQRASGVLGVLAALWLAVSLWWIRRKERIADTLIQLGCLQYDEEHHRFLVNGCCISFTPMQQELMKLFMTAPEHRLRQKDICDHLWPRKPDASATLYTLIRRLKRILHEVAGMNIECQRGEAYQLKTSE